MMSTGWQNLRNTLGLIIFYRGSTLVQRAKLKTSMAFYGKVL